MSLKTCSARLEATTYIQFGREALTIPEAEANIKCLGAAAKDLELLLNIVRELDNAMPLIQVMGLYPGPLMEARKQFEMSP